MPLRLQAVTALVRYVAWGDEKSAAIVATTAALPEQVNHPAVLVCDERRQQLARENVTHGDASRSCTSEPSKSSCAFLG